MAAAPARAVAWGRVSPASTQGPGGWQERHRGEATFPAPGPAAERCCLDRGMGLLPVTAPARAESPLPVPPGAEAIRVRGSGLTETATGVAVAAPEGLGEGAWPSRTGGVVPPVVVARWAGPPVVVAVVVAVVAAVVAARCHRAEAGFLQRACSGTAARVARPLPAAMPASGPDQRPSARPPAVEAGRRPTEPGGQKAGSAGIRDLRGEADRTPECRRVPRSAEQAAAALVEVEVEAAARREAPMAAHLEAAEVAAGARWDGARVGTTGRRPRSTSPVQELGRSRLPPRCRRAPHARRTDSVGP